jgi:hypothetical protein
MRIALLVLILLAFTAFQLPNKALAVSPSCSATICTISVVRSVSTNDWGTTFVNDTVVLNATSPVSSLTLGMPSSVSANLRSIAASDNQGTLQVLALAQNQTGRYVPYQFIFPSSVNGTYSFKVRGVFGDLITFNTATSKYTFAFSPLPVVEGTLKAARGNVTVLTRDWPSPVILPGNLNVTGGRFSRTISPISSFNAAVSSIVFSSVGTTQSMYDAKAARTIDISQQGALQVADTYNVTNKGKDAPNLAFALPLGSMMVTCSDLIGQLDPTNCPVPTLLSDGTLSETFSPRFGSVKNSGSAIVTLHYSLPSSSYIQAGGLGRYTLTFQMLNGVKFVSSTLQTKIILPTGFKLGAFSGQTPVVSGNQLTLSTSPLTPYTSLSFTMSYQLDPFWSGLSFLGWAGLLEGAVAVVSMVLISGSQGALVVAAPSQMIARLVELYDEKSSLRLEEDKLDEDLSRGAVNKHDYKRRKRVMDLRLAELDKLLAPVKDGLSRTQTRYGDMIKRIEKAEAELRVVKGSLADLKNQNRTGRISRELYDQLSGDLFRRVTRAQQTIDNVIIGLREEAR